MLAPGPFPVPPSRGSRAGRRAGAAGPWERSPARWQPSLPQPRPGSESESENENENGPAPHRPDRPRQWERERERARPGSAPGLSSVTAGPGRASLPARSSTSAAQHKEQMQAADRCMDKYISK